jgi:hypothetical protein
MARGAAGHPDISREIEKKQREQERGAAPGPANFF